MLGDQGRVLGAAPQRYERAAVAERGLAQALRHLSQKLMRQRESKHGVEGVDLQWDYVEYLQKALADAEAEREDRRKLPNLIMDTPDV